MVTGIDIVDLADMAGHEEGPFAIDEFITPLLKRGIALVVAYSEINLSFLGTILPHNLVVFNAPAIISGIVKDSDLSHAVAWDGEQAIDPATGTTVSLASIFSDICMVTNIFEVQVPLQTVWEKYNCVAS